MENMIRSLLITGFLFLVFTPVIQASDNADHRKLLAKHYRLEKPDGTGPFPAVMMVPGCSGFQSDLFKGHYDAIQRRLVELGFVTLRVDYLAARNASSCTEGVSSEDAAGDIRIAADYLTQQSFVKKGAVNVMGWSYGASGALQALGRTWNREPVKVDAVIVYYPHCNFVQQKWESQIPVLVLSGVLDNVAPIRFCKGLFVDLPVTVRKYDGAHHCFDMVGLPAKAQYEFGTIGYNEAAARAAWLEVSNFLRR